MTSQPPPKKALGQHWLLDEPSLEAICEAADLKMSDTVLEIGPGLGSLTELLSARAAKVIAVEIDEALSGQLKARFPAPNLEIINGDILSFNLTNLPMPYKLVANIPYYISGQLIRLISESANPPILSAILVQKEVADRVTASPGQMSILSVTAQFYWEVALGPIIPAALFTPPPKVDSQVLILRRRSRPLFAVPSKAFFRLVKIGFSQRRKTLLNNLSSGLRLGREATQQALLSADIEPNRRAQTLSLSEWHKLYTKLT